MTHSLCRLGVRYFLELRLILGTLISRFPRHNIRTKLQSTLTAREKVLVLVFHGSNFSKKGKNKINEIAGDPPQNSTYTQKFRRG